MSKKLAVYDDDNSEDIDSPYIEPKYILNGDKPDKRANKKPQSAGRGRGRGRGRVPTKNTRDPVKPIPVRPKKSADVGSKKIDVGGAKSYADGLRNKWEYKKKKYDIAVKLYETDPQPDILEEIQALKAECNNLADKYDIARDMLDKREKQDEDE